ncbi:MAG: hypothetical protein V3R78_09940 [Thermodesulfobacteriota bacterium]
MRIKLGGNELFNGAGLTGVLTPYINKKTGKSDPQIRFEWGVLNGNPRPGAFANMSDVSGLYEITDLDTGKVYSRNDLMDYKG